jgi:hypothetical protein
MLKDREVETNKSIFATFVWNAPKLTLTISKEILDVI